MELMKSQIFCQNQLASLMQFRSGKTFLMFWLSSKILFVKKKEHSF